MSGRAGKAGTSVGAANLERLHLPALKAERAVALGVYLALSFLYFGLPVASHFGRDWIGSGTDPQIFVWSLAWWPHAVLHWQNPVVTHAVWPPVGLDLTWVSSIPALAAVFAPVTLTAGPVAAYNAASILVPALGAWTAFLLCRHVTRSYWPSLAGGYLFGFSSYELGHLQGHLHMSSVFLVPLAALLVIRYVEGSLDDRGLVLRLGPLLAVQFLLSTELLFIDVTKQVVALNELVEVERVVELLPGVASAAALRKKLSRLLGSVWSECWVKAKQKKRKPPAPKKGKRDHTSVFRLLQTQRKITETSNST